MNTIDCRILQNEYQEVPVRGMTPAEALILRQIHDSGAATQSKMAKDETEKANCWKVVRYAKPAGVALTVIGEDAKGKEKTRPRTNAEEASRLRGKYLMRAKSGAHGSHILDDLFPGENPDLPETFEEIGLAVDAPVEDKKRTADAA